MALRIGCRCQWGLVDCGVSVLDQHLPALQLPKPRNQKQRTSSNERFTPDLADFSTRSGIAPPHSRAALQPKRTTATGCSQTRYNRQSIIPSATRLPFWVTPRRPTVLRPGLSTGLPFSRTKRRRPHTQVSSATERRRLFAGKPETEVGLRAGVPKDTWKCLTFSRRWLPTKYLCQLWLKSNCDL